MIWETERIFHGRKFHVGDEVIWLTSLRGLDFKTEGTVKRFTEKRIWIELRDGEQKCVDPNSLIGGMFCGIY